MTRPSWDPPLLSFFSLTFFFLFPLLHHLIFSLLFSFFLIDCPVFILPLLTSLVFCLFLFLLPLFSFLKNHHLFSPLQFSSNLPLTSISLLAIPDFFFHRNMFIPVPYIYAIPSFPLLLKLVVSFCPSLSSPFPSFSSLTLLFPYFTVLSVSLLLIPFLSLPFFYSPPLKSSSLCILPQQQCFAVDLTGG